MLPDALRDEHTEPQPDATPRRRPRRGLGQPSVWQIIVAAVVILIALAGLCRITGLLDKLRPLPQPTPTPTATLVPTPTPIPTFTPLPTAEPTITATPVPVLAPGGLATVSGTGGAQLRLRAAAGLTGETLRILDEGTNLHVLEGPQQADGYNWWKVQTDDGLAGWVAADWLAPLAP